MPGDPEPQAQIPAAPAQQQQDGVSQQGQSEGQSEAQAQVVLAKASNASSASSDLGELGKTMTKAWNNFKDTVSKNAVPPPIRKGPSIREDRGTQYYLHKEAKELQQLIDKLETAVMNAHSFREKASRLLEEAHRASGRLELAIQAQQHQELIVVASEMKACVRRGLTLVHVYGEFSMTWKVLTQMFRSAAYEKFDKAIVDLQSLLPQPKPTPPAITSGTGAGDAAYAAGTQQSGSNELPSSLVQAGSVNVAGAAASTMQGRGLGRTSNQMLGQSRSAAPPSSAGVAASIRGGRGSSASGNPPPTGKVLKEGKADRVLSAAFVPLQVSSNYTCLWWSTSTMLEFWTEAGGSTTGFRMGGKDSQLVTAIGIDGNGNVWTGHQRGLVRVRQKMQWDLVLSDKAFNLAIKCIAFDERQGDAWVGDEGGHVKVMRCSYPDTFPTDHEHEPSMKPRRRSTIMTKSFMDGRGLGSARRDSTLPGEGEEIAHTQLDVIATLQPSLLEKITKGWFECFSCGSSPRESEKRDRPTEGPIRCILLKDNRAWISGGMQYSQPWLAMFDSTSYQHIDTWECGLFGPANAMETLTWHAPYTPPRPSLEGHNINTARAPSAPTQPMWRLLTAHENGQLLLWNPSSKKLAPLIMIGEPTSPIKGMKVLDDEQLVCTAHYNGDLHLFAQPPLEVMVPPGAQAAKAESFGTFRPKTAMLKAHKGYLMGMVGGANSCATWSWVGSIKLWSARDFVETMGRQGLIRALSLESSGERLSLAHPSPQGSGAGALDRLCNGAAAEMRGTRPLQHSHSAFAQGTPYQKQLQTQYSSVSQAASADDKISPPTSGGGTSREGSGATRGGSSGGDKPSQAFGSGVQLIESNEIALKKQIGSGAYGRVYLAEWLGCQVAVKELTGFVGDIKESKAWQDMQHEVHMLGTYNHPNIMRFMAVCLDPPMIVMQYYSHGSLFDLLSRAQRQNVRAMRELTWPKRLGMLKDVAAGMHYLHTRKPPVVHGDLRSPNLLLDLTIDSERPRFHVKIADFGLARMLGQSSSIAVSKTTNPRWTAPEVIRDFVLGPSGDVYSFAIIMWEMLTWKQPYEDMMSAQVIFSTVTADYRPSLEDDDIAGTPGVTLPKFKELMEQCWSPDAAKRPTFKRIVEILQGMLDEESQAAKDSAAQQKDRKVNFEGGLHSAPKSGGVRKGGVAAGSKSAPSSKGPQNAQNPPPATLPQPPSSDPASTRNNALPAADPQSGAESEKQGQQEVQTLQQARLPQLQQQQQPPKDSASSVPMSEVAGVVAGKGRGPENQRGATRESEDGPSMLPLAPSRESQQQGVHNRAQQQRQPQPPSATSPAPLHNPLYQQQQGQQQGLHQQGTHTPSHPAHKHQRGHSFDDGSWGGGNFGVGQPGGPGGHASQGARRGSGRRPSQNMDSRYEGSGMPPHHRGGMSHQQGQQQQGQQGQYQRGYTPPQQHQQWGNGGPSYQGHGHGGQGGWAGGNSRGRGAGRGPQGHNNQGMVHGASAPQLNQQQQQQQHQQAYSASRLSHAASSVPAGEGRGSTLSHVEKTQRTQSNGSAADQHNGGKQRAQPGGEQGPTQATPRSSSPESTTSSKDEAQRSHRRRQRNRRKPDGTSTADQGHAQQQHHHAHFQQQQQQQQQLHWARHPHQQHQNQNYHHLQQHAPYPRRQGSAQSNSSASGREGGQPRPYAPLKHTSPFSAPPPSAAESAKPYAPLASSSPFSAPPPPPPSRQAAAEDAKPYAPLASSSPFSSPPPPLAEEAKPYAPLAASSPFSAPPPPTAEEAKPYVPLAASSPFSAPPPPPAEEAKPYAPLAASSPFSSPPPAEEAKPYAPLAASSPFSAPSPPTAEEARPYAPLAANSPFASLPPFD